MKIIEWLENNATKSERECFGEPMEIWVTKLRGDYLTHVGMEDKLRFLSDIGLSQVQSSWEAGKPVNIGYCAADGKWYGWSHRAICGFAVGSEVSKGDCGYAPKDADDFLSSILDFWRDEKNHAAINGEHAEQSCVKGVLVSWVYNEEVPNQELHGKVSSIFTPYPVSWGRGAWKAKTLEDAKQMAIDFAESVS